MQADIPLLIRQFLWDFICLTILCPTVTCKSIRKVCTDRLYKAEFTVLQKNKMLIKMHGKGKVHPITCYYSPEGEMCSSTLPSMGVGDQRHTPATSPPVKTWYPLYRRLGRPQGWSGRVWKILPPPGFDPQTVQSIVSHYNDCAIVALTKCMGGKKLLWSC